MIQILLISALMQVILPLLMFLWLWRGHPHTQIEYLLKTILIGSYLVAIALAGLWSVVPLYIPYLYIALFLVMVAVALPPLRDRPWLPACRPAKVRAGVAAILAVLCVSLAAYALSGRLPPAGEPASLAFPLRTGTYYVASGGSNILLNLHLRALRWEAARGQSYALDIFKLDRMGVHASGLLPPDPARYAIFGDPVFAPCDGVVVQTETDLPDLPPPLADDNHPFGNHVLLECDALWVLLAHLKQASVAVRAGDRVREGQVLAQVGNSGFTQEPHLHIHAQRPGSSGVLLGGDPVPMMFDGRYLARNDLVR